MKRLALITLMMGGVAATGMTTTAMASDDLRWSITIGNDGHRHYRPRYDYPRYYSDYRDYRRHDRYRDHRFDRGRHYGWRNHPRYYAPPAYVYVVPRGYAPYRYAERRYYDSPRRDRYRDRDCADRRHRHWGRHRH